MSAVNPAQDIRRFSAYRTGPQEKIPGVRLKQNLTIEMPVFELMEMARLAEANTRSRTQQVQLAVQEHLDRLAPGWRDRKAAWLEELRAELTREPAVSERAS